MTLVLTLIHRGVIVTCATFYDELVLMTIVTIVLFICRPEIDFISAITTVRAASHFSKLELIRVWARLSTAAAAVIRL